MPNLILPIPVTYESVTRHVTQSVVERVKELTAIPVDVPIRFPGSLARMYQNGSTVSSEEKNQFEHASKIAITVQEEYQEESTLSLPVRHTDMRYIFEDDKANIFLKPIYSYTTTTINFTYRGQTRSQVERWRDDIRVRLSDNRQAHLHELSYHYPLPKSALVILHHLHSLRENQAGYGEDFKTYLKNHLTYHATTLTTLAGTEPLLVIRERQVGIQGWFEFIEPPEADKDDGGSSWTVSFSYKFTYQKPVSTHFKYPLVVHNQFIDHRFYSDKPAYRLNRDILKPGDQRHVFNRLEDMFEKPADPISGLRYPVFDDWIPTQLPPHTASVCTWLIGLEPTDLQAVVDLKDLGDHELVPVFKRFLKHEAPYLTKRGQSVVYFTLFEEDLPMNDDVLTIDSDLNVRTTRPLDLRKTYHLRMSFITEFSLLTARARDAMLTHGFSTVLILQTLINHLDADYAFRNLLDYEYLVRTWFTTLPSPPIIDEGLVGRPIWFQDFLQWTVDNNHGGLMSDKYLGWFESELRKQLLGYPQSGVGGQLTNGTYHIEWALVAIVTVIADHS